MARGRGGGEADQVLGLLGAGVLRVEQLEGQALRARGLLRLHGQPPVVLADAVEDEQANPADHGPAQGVLARSVLT
jgi:hypothetical protein